MSNEHEGKETETFSDELAAVRRLESVIAEVQGTGDEAALKENLSVRLALESLGYAVHMNFLRMLRSCRVRGLSSNEPKMMRVISHDQPLCRKMQGSLLGRSLLMLFAHEPIRRAATRRFIMEMNHPTEALEKSLQYHFVECAVAAGLECGLVGARCIESIEHYLQLARVARRRLNSAAYRYPQPPFVLPEGWQWFTTGDDFKRLADYPAISSNHDVEMHHAAVWQRQAFLLRDSAGGGWIMRRIDAGNSDEIARTDLPLR